MASAAWERRNARARALGFESYYDYRAHDYGRRPASEARATGESLARLRGHRGAGDLDKLLQSGRVELVNVIRTGPKEKELLVTTSDGTTRTFTLKGDKAISRTRDTLAAMGPDAPQVEGSDESLAELVAGYEDAAEQAAMDEYLAELEAEGATEDEAEELGGQDEFPF